MAEKTDKRNNISLLREEVQAPTLFLLTQLQKDLDDNLLSLCVVGSALTDDFHPKYSDINTVLVVQRRSHQLLKQLAGYGKSMGKRKLRAPLLMTMEYIEQSLDVFGVELLDFQFNHVVVYGRDPFGELTFRKENIRLQCERQLKAALIRLRQGYIQALGKPKYVSNLLMECVKELLVLLRALLWLSEIERDHQVLPNLKKAAQQFRFDGKVIAHLMELQLQHSRPPADQIEFFFENVYQTIDHIAHGVDRQGKE